MNIAELNNTSEGQKVSLRVMITDKTLLPKKNSKELYLLLEVQDATGKFAFPVWNDVAILYDAFPVGGLVDIVNGTVGFWNGAVQLQNPMYHILSPEEEAETNRGDFIPTYPIDAKLVEWFRETVENMAEPYRTVAKHITGLENSVVWKQFTTCVSASKHHGNKIGGLFLHTCGVLKILENVIDDYLKKPMYPYENTKEVVNIDRLKLKAIFHDIKKIDEYDYDTVIRRKPDKKLGHIYDGIAFVKQVNEELGYILSEEDTESILWAILTHHGEYGPEKPTEIEDVLLHLADMIDSRIVGAMEG